MLDGEFANNLDIIQMNQTFSLNSMFKGKSIMDDRLLTLKYANVPAYIHKIRNWEIQKKKRCVFDMYVKKVSTGDK